MSMVIRPGNRLRSGIPTLDEYHESLASKRFSVMERFSSHFLEGAGQYLSRYAAQWVADPLHSWSRQWEYPYVLAEIENYLAKRPGETPFTVLDAGSGITFFPFLVAEDNSKAVVTCLDQDSTLEGLYRDVNAELGTDLVFEHGNLMDLHYPDSTFDIIYCISVLEHLPEVTLAIAELTRVLKPGGLLVITFDLSLDGYNDISCEDGKRLHAQLTRSILGGRAEPEPGLSEIDRRESIVETGYFRTHHPALLPWRYPLLSAIRSWSRFRFRGSLSKDFTFFCASYLRLRTRE